MADRPSYEFPLPNGPVKKLELVTDRELAHSKSEYTSHCTVSRQLK
jgi:hypothetical protein